MTRETVEELRSNPPVYHPGWGGPEYTSWQDEQMSWKTTCYVGDWSFLQDLEVRGPRALDLFRNSCVNSFEKFAIGQAKHAIQCNDDGKVIGEGVLMRIADEVFRIQGNPVRWTHFLAVKGSYDVNLELLDTFQLQVSGPAALALCEKLTGETLTDIKFMHFRAIEIAGRPAFALRQGMAGEIGFEFHGNATDKDDILRQILTVGEEFGIRRLGSRTAMINHLEAAFPTGRWTYLNAAQAHDEEAYVSFQQVHYPRSIARTVRGSFEATTVEDYTYSPYELGWGKSVKFDHEFIGRDALEKESKAGPARTRVTLEFCSDDVIQIYASLFKDGTPYDILEIPHPQRWVMWADAVIKDGEVCGISATPGYSFFFRKVISLAFIRTDLSAPGTEVEILWGSPGTPQMKVRATVASAPYKTDNRRSGFETSASAQRTNEAVQIAADADRQ